MRCECRDYFRHSSCKQQSHLERPRLDPHVVYRPAKTIKFHIFIFSLKWIENFPSTLKLAAFKKSRSIKDWAHAKCDWVNLLSIFSWTAAIASVSFVKFPYPRHSLTSLSFTSSKLSIVVSTGWIDFTLWRGGFVGSSSFGAMVEDGVAVAEVDGREPWDDELFSAEIATWNSFSIVCCTCAYCDTEMFCVQRK